MAAGPDVIMLPKARGGTDISHLAAKLAVREAEHALDDGSTAIIAIATETADAIFGLHSYARSSHRLLGLTWGAEDLAADIGAEANRVGGEMTEPFRLARNLMLFAAAAAEVIPIDTVHVDIRDAAGLESECRAARRDGFAGKMAIHPDQIAVINRVFTPDPAEIARARAILAHFEANPDSGVVAINGKMVDRPHLRSAARLMERARAAGVA
jgi:citrate lyase subunit beta/citryl-CoA lyase